MLWISMNRTPNSVSLFLSLILSPSSPSHVSLNLCVSLASIAVSPFLSLSLSNLKLSYTYVRISNNSVQKVVICINVL